MLSDSNGPYRTVSELQCCEKALPIAATRAWRSKDGSRGSATQDLATAR